MLVTCQPGPPRPSGRAGGQAEHGGKDSTAAKDTAAKDDGAKATAAKGTGAKDTGGGTTRRRKGAANQASTP